MRIGEVSSLTGLSASNIRFYEKKGLLAPVRDKESKYRDYSNEDIKRLKQIVLYRKMNLPVETIYLLFQGEVSLTGVLKRQQEELAGQIDMLQGSVDLCRKILEDSVQDGDLQNMDVDYYLNYVREEEDAGKKFAQIEELLEDFSWFSGLNAYIVSPLRGSGRMGKLFRNAWFFRGISAVYFLLCVAVPVVRVANIWMRGGPMEYIAFWIVWFAGFSWAFWKFRKRAG